MSFWQGIPVARDDWNSEIGVATECFIKSMILMNLNSFFLVIFKNHVDESTCQKLFSHPSFLCRIFVCQQKPEQSPCGEDG